MQPPRAAPPRSRFAVTSSAPSHCSATVAALALAAAVLLPTVTAAQEIAPPAPEPPAILIGRVTNVDGDPLANALVAVVGTTSHTYTDLLGTYRLGGVPIGRQTLEIRLIGHRRQALVLHLYPAERMQVDIVMQVEPTPLEGVEVAVSSRLGERTSPTLDGFYHRRSRGGGVYFTRDDVEHMQARQFTDVLRRVPGTRITPVSGPYGPSQTVQMGRAVGMSGNSRCTVLYYVNGAPFPVAADVSINNFIQPDDIAGIEVYSGASSIPPQFNSSLHGARCGVVVIWTYAGEHRREVASSVEKKPEESNRKKKKQ